METRKYHRDSSESSHTKEDNGNFSDAESTMSTQSDTIGSKCVICLEKFEDGQVCKFNFFKNKIFNLAYKTFDLMLKVAGVFWKTLIAECQMTLRLSV